MSGAARHEAPLKNMPQPIIRFRQGLLAGGGAVPASQSAEMPCAGSNIGSSWSMGHTGWGACWRKRGACRSARVERASSAFKERNAKWRLDAPAQVSLSLAACRPPAAMRDAHVGSAI